MQREHPVGERGAVELLFRRHSGELVAVLARVFGARHLALAEDVAQEAFVRALERWPFDGIPDNPRGWLFQVARNRALDRLRRTASFRTRLPRVEEELGRDRSFGSGGEGAFRSLEGPRFEGELRDDAVALLFGCCHPTLSRDAQVALVLKTVGGFSVREIARAFLSKPPTVAARLSRARARLAETDDALEIPANHRLAARLDSALEALYLIFNEGYQAFEGEQLIREDLCREALRLARLVAEHPRTAAPRCWALCALLAFQAARLPARTDRDGELVLLEDQDRTLWDRGLQRFGLQSLRRSAAGVEESRYHLEAEIASCHSLASSAEETDWERILRGYDRLLELEASPVVALNRAVALAHVEGEGEALRAVEALEGHAALRRYQPYWMTRGELARRVGHREIARASFEIALELSASDPARRHLERKLSGLPRVVREDREYRARGRARNPDRG